MKENKVSSNDLVDPKEAKEKKMIVTFRGENRSDFSIGTYGMIYLRFSLARSDLFIKNIRFGLFKKSI